MKTCRKCNQDKPLDDYTVDTRYKDGRYPWCAECRRAWRQARKDRTRELNAAWRDENRDRSRELGRETYQRHKAEYSEKRRTYDRKRWHSDPAHRERKNQWKREKYHSDVAYRAKRRNISGARHHRLYYNDPAYRQQKREYTAAYEPRRKHYGRYAAGGFTRAEWQALCARYDHRCLCCGAQKPLSPDHVIPLSRGGANTIDNIQPLCRDCNATKFTKTMDFRPDWVGF